VIQLRPYQQAIIKETRDLMVAGKKRILICAPTGSGKTALTAHMLGGAAKKNMNSFFIVHRRELIKQSIAAFSKAGFGYGVCASGFVETPKQPVNICSIQTLAHRYRRYKPPQMICWDECHHISAGTWDRIFKLYPNAYHIGLTATPHRTDGTGLRPWFQEIIHGPSVSWLIDNGFLCDYKIYAPPSMDTSGLHVRMGDYIKSELNRKFDKPSVTGDAVREYKKLANGKRALVFCFSIEHSQHVAEQFRQSGITAEHVDGGTDPFSRDLSMERFRTGKTQVITSVEIFGEGVDIPALECVILLRPTMSLGLYLQQVGRVLRPSEGKTQAIILDHAGNCERHGLPDAEREWSLDGRDKESQSRVAGVRTCPICFAAQGIGSLTCKFCGFLFIPEPREIEHKSGELTEVEVQQKRADRKAEWKACKTLEDFNAMGQRRGYSPGWAVVQFNLKRQWGLV
jgi:superfamily II DNA or RNA helicase